MASLHAPLPTLRRLPHGSRRTAWGQCGSLRLHCGGLPPLTPCRSPGALQPAERLTHVETDGPLVGHGLAAYLVCQSQSGLVLFMIYQPAWTLTLGSNSP